TSTDLGFCSGWFFFFQAEDGIRDFHVTGVQTCALPIYRDQQRRPRQEADRQRGQQRALAGAGEVEQTYGGAHLPPHEPGSGHHRSEERRVGREGRSRWATRRY